MKLYGIRYDKPGRDTKHIRTGGLVHLYGVEVNVLGHDDVITPIYSSREQAEREIAEAEDNYLGNAPKVVILNLEPEVPCEWCADIEANDVHGFIWRKDHKPSHPIWTFSFCPNCGRSLK